MKTLFTGVGGLAWAGLLSLTIPASAGQLDSKWNGSIEWNDDSYYNITSDCSSRHTVISQTHVDTQYLHDYAWENRYNRVISVDLANGGWTVGMRGNFHIVASDAVNHASFQPPRSSVDCQWLLDSEPPIEIGTTGGKLSVDTGNDCSYTIALNGLQGSCGGNYLLEACFDTQACGYVSVSGALPTTFAGDPPPITEKTADKDNLQGNDTGYTQGAPAWCATLANNMVQTICAATPDSESASIAAGARLSPFVAGYYSNRKWNLHRSPSGHWAGTVNYTLNYVNGGPSAFTNTIPVNDGDLVGTSTTRAWKDGSLGYVITLPEDGQPQSAHIFEHVKSHYTVSTIGQKSCQGTTSPYNYTYVSQVALESDDTVQSGVTVTITNLGYLSLGILEVETPGIAENNTATYGLTIVDDCDGGTVEDGSTPAHDTFFVDEYGQQDWMITLNCGSTSNGSNSQNKKGTQETWTWDLHFVADDTPNPGTAGSKASAKTTAVGALDDPQLGVAIPVTGTIQCGFAYFDTATNTVPDDQPGAGSTFQTQDSFQYAASLVYSATGGFQAVVEAGEWQTNRIATLETEICTESNDASEITSTNVVPITRLETLAARLTNTVQATVSATVTNDQYHVHVEIPSAQGGHSTKLLSVNRLPACAAIPTNTEDAVASDDWGTGTRVLDFHGTLDPADPATLSGQIQMDHGWITWNLKTSVSPSLFLHVQSVTGGTFRVWWNAGANVRLQRSDLLTNPAWQDVPDTLGSSNTMLSPAEQSLFFRLMMNP